MLPLPGEIFFSPTGDRTHFRVLESPLSGLFRCVATRLDSIPFEVTRRCASRYFREGTWKVEYEAIIDFKGEPITIGTVVAFDALPATDRYPGQEATTGIVTGISDVDGDVDDEGRSIAIYPSVTVRYADGTTEEFGTSWTGRWHDDDAPFEAGDLLVAFHGPENFNPTKEQAA